MEGRFWNLTYYPQATAKSKPSELQILRNFESAAKKLGGTVLWSDKSRETLRITKEGKDFWVDVWAEFTGKYGLRIIEKQAMAQDIVANADALLNDLNTTGHAAVYGIAAFRMKAFGNGPYAPVASNDTEEGKAKNRRVELVKQ